MFFFGSAAGDRSFAIDVALMWVCLVVAVAIVRVLIKTAGRMLARVTRYRNVRRAEREAWFRIEPRARFVLRNNKDIVFCRKGRCDRG